MYDEKITSLVSRHLLFCGHLIVNAASCGYVICILNLPIYHWKTHYEIMTEKLTTIQEKLVTNGEINAGEPSQTRTKSGLMKLSSYVLALRPWSLSGSLMPTLLGSTIAYKCSGNPDFNYITLLLTVLTVVSVHGAGNVVNTYFDYVKGIDNRKSDDRILVDHILTKDEVVSLGALLYFAGCVGFILLATISPAKWNIWHWFILEDFLPVFFILEGLASNI
ncbi:unnamed protein product [Callosobruchus maculatus]|uniref:UbiA prenyltransferase domain-containing protein 1 n=1 Tax=Callosobruchus maculatus TaxID=64391 RepID=A0A653D7F8_CALMS|nr:unnamed protein product [Callosobruchus maculatus]